MERLKGQSVSEGIAIGPCLVLTTHDVHVRETIILPSKSQAEVRRFHKAMSDTRADFKKLEGLAKDSPEDVSRIIDTSLQILEDPYIVKTIEDKITEKHFSAPFAVHRVMAQLSERLSAMEDPIFSSKVSDIHDIERRLVNHLMGGSLERLDDLKKPTVIVADDLSPTQVATLDRSNVIGFVTERGSWASHTSILARALGIPAVVGAPRVTKLATLGATVIIDGFTGKVVIDPDTSTTESYRIERRRARRAAEIPKSQRLMKAETRDGTSCEVFGNIETKDDVSRVLDAGGTGIGLFRTEFIFLGQAEPPDEDCQFRHYSEAVQAAQNGVVTIRTMDFGGDKFDRRTNEDGEPNPFMGERAIRVSFKHEGLFRTQLRAILRAGLQGRVRLMFPMIMDVGEFRRAVGLVDKVKSELRRARIPFAEDMPIGTMIELPSAALSASALADEVDFFSIGTNDLTQFCLGVDRTNHRVSSLFAPHHPSVLRLIREVTRAGEAVKKPVSLCGEMGGNVWYTPLLLGLGIYVFSVSPPLIAGVKRAIRSVEIARCRDLAERALAAPDAASVKAMLDEFHG